MSAHTYPEKILPTVISDMMAYHKHGYSFKDYCDRNTYGRNYGKELYPIWEKTLKQFKEDKKHDSISENLRDEGQQGQQNRRGKRKQHL